MLEPLFCSSTARYRWSVFSRVVAATAGGYGITWLFSAAHALVLFRLGVERADAALAAMLFSFIVYAFTAMAVFHARSATRAWLWLAGVGVVLGLLVWALRVWSMAL